MVVLDAPHELIIAVTQTVLITSIEFVNRDDIYLINKGWKLAAIRNNGYGKTHYWSHPAHQPKSHGFFTKTTAVTHQKKVDKYGMCKCLVEEPLHSEEFYAREEVEV